MMESTDLTAGPVSAHLRRLAVPYSIGMVFAILYNLVDTFFAGLLSTEALAALAIAFPLFFAPVSLALGINAAVVALVGNALGGGDRAYAKRLICQSLSYAALISVVLALAGFLVLPWLVEGVTAEAGAVRGLTLGYLNVLLIATPSFFLFYSANGALLAQGSAVAIMKAQIGNLLANIVLTPLMVFGIPGLVDGIGFNGIALSTLVSQTGAMLYTVRVVLRSETMRTDAPSAYRLQGDDSWNLTAQALPTAIGMGLIIFSGYIVQLYLKEFGAGAIAGFGIAVRVEQLLLLPGIALAFSLRPLVAQNFGAGEPGRVRESFSCCCKSGVLLMAAGAVLLWLGCRYAIALFADDAEVIERGGEILAVLGFLMPFTFLVFTVNSLLQGLKHPAWVLWIIIYERGVGIALFATLLLILWPMSVWAVWLGIATSVVSGCLLALAIAAAVARREIGGLFAPSS
ncbi:MAG: MATE family efflux transporter [Nitrospira sp.]|nr:MATE family efflux transporter [Nitrospira sp.]